jgi:hypothetical protein
VKKTIRFNHTLSKNAFAIAVPPDTNVVLFSGADQVDAVGAKVATADIEDVAAQLTEFQK